MPEPLVLPPGPVHVDEVIRRMIQSHADLSHKYWNGFADYECLRVYFQKLNRE